MAGRPMTMLRRTELNVWPQSRRRTGIYVMRAHSHQDGTVTRRDRPVRRRTGIQVDVIDRSPDPADGLVHSRSA